MKTLLLAVTALVASPTGPNALALDEAPATPPAWRVSRGDAGAELFLFAAAPVPRRTVLKLPASIEQAYARAERLVLTSDRAQLELSRKLELLARHAPLPDGESLADRVGAERRARLVAALERSDSDPAPAQGLKPAFAAGSLRQIDLERIDFFDEEEIEFYFFSRAQRDGKQQLALETTESLVRRIARLGDAVQVAVLDEALLASARVEERIPALHAAWTRGDLAALERSAFELARAHPELEPAYESLLFSESARIAADLDGLLDRPGSSFAVVGAVHLVGERGVLELLRKRGCAIERLEGEGGS